MRTSAERTCLRSALGRWRTLVGVIWKVGFSCVATVSVTTVSVTLSSLLGTFSNQTAVISTGTLAIQRAEIGLAIIDKGAIPRKSGILVKFGKLPQPNKSYIK